MTDISALCLMIIDLTGILSHFVLNATQVICPGHPQSCLVFFNSILLIVLISLYVCFVSQLIVNLVDGSLILSSCSLPDFIGMKEDNCHLFFLYPTLKSLDGAFIFASRRLSCILLSLLFFFFFFV